MAQVHEAWCPQAWLRTNAPSSESVWSPRPGSSSSAINPGAPDSRSICERRRDIFLAALIELPEIDYRRIAWVLRAKCHLARAVSRVRLQHEPGQIIVTFREGAGVTGPVSGKAGQQAHAEEIG
jgi:hypothetical protein